MIKLPQNKSNKYNQLQTTNYIYIVITIHLNCTTNMYCQNINTLVIVVKQVHDSKSW